MHLKRLIVPHFLFPNKLGNKFRLQPNSIHIYREVAPSITQDLDSSKQVLLGSLNSIMDANPKQICFERGDFHTSFLKGKAISDSHSAYPPLFFLGHLNDPLY